MKVAILAPYPPYPPRGGGQQRMYQIIRQLASRHMLHLITFTPDDRATVALEALQPFCRITTVPAPSRTRLQRLGTTLLSARPDMLWRGHAPLFAETLQLVLQTERYDVVQAESIEMTQYAPHAAAGGPLWVYDAWNVEYTIQQRAFLMDLHRPKWWLRAGYSLLQWFKLRRYEQRLHRSFAGTFVVSQGDQTLLQQLDPQLATTIVANGVDTGYFCPQPATVPVPTILFTGTLDYRPNVDAIQWFAATVWPHILRQSPSARLRIVGRNPGIEVHELASQAGIEIWGDVVDVRPFFNAASVYVVPMRIGGGVRLKVLEAFAQDVPVVATALGVEGIAGLQQGVQAVVANESAPFADAVVQLLRNKNQATTLTRAARALVLQRYDWSALIPRMEDSWMEWQAKRGSAKIS
ncbi:MAG: glycosyltransferase [Herpetosiphonaceae bacterium]|nr:glycosyltransferase [Herpetosiphonaceae bacterium]